MYSYVSKLFVYAFSFKFVILLYYYWIKNKTYKQNKRINNLFLIENTNLFPFKYEGRRLILMLVQQTAGWGTADIHM